MSSHRSVRFGSIEVRPIRQTNTKSGYQLLRKGRAIAGWQLAWGLKSKVDDEDVKVFAESHLVSHQNLQALAEDIGFSLDLESLLEAERNVLTYFACSSPKGIPAKKLEDLSHLFLKDAFLKSISAFGPIALRNHRVQEALASWLNEGDKRAGEAIQGIYDALKSYAEVTKKPGKPENLKLKVLGTKLLKRRYREITAILKFIKLSVGGLKRRPNKTDIRELWNKAQMNYYEDLGLDFSEETVPPDDIEVQSITPVPDLLVNDEWFTNEFLSFTYEPNCFAKVIIAKLLRSTFDTIDKLL